jgi:hypothetical protein
MYKNSPVGFCFFNSEVTEKISRNVAEAFTIFENLNGT